MAPPPRAWYRGMPLLDVLDYLDGDTEGQDPDSRPVRVLGFAIDRYIRAAPRSLFGSGSVLCAPVLQQIEA